MSTEQIDSRDWTKTIAEKIQKNGTPHDPRQQAYTTPRPDIVNLVPTAAMDILDVGCSNGALGEGLVRAVPGRRVTGVEWDPVFCEEARGRLSAVHNADVNNLDWSRTFGLASFDCLIFADVLEHLVDPWERLASACACLRPGGSVVVSVPNIRHVSAMYSIFIRGTFPRRSRGIFDNTHLRWFTLRDADALLTGAGLEIQAGDHSLRVRDRGDGRLNRIARKLLSPVQGFYPVREFLTYQVSLRGMKPGHPSGSASLGKGFVNQ